MRPWILDGGHVTLTLLGVLAGAAIDWTLNGPRTRRRGADLLLM